MEVVHQVHLLARDGRVSHLYWLSLIPVGDTVGCGINFIQKRAFFTKNGKMIGESFLTYEN